ncbi:MAG: hypothetical protein ACOCWC_05210 [Bacteroidota bacterium]
MTKTQKFFWLFFYLLLTALSSWMLNLGIIGWILNYLIVSPIVFYFAILVFHKEEKSYPF